MKSRAGLSNTAELNLRLTPKQISRPFVQTSSRNQLDDNGYIARKELGNCQSQNIQTEALFLDLLTYFDE